MTVLITAHNGPAGQLGPLSSKTLLAHFLFPHTTLRPASKRRQGFEASSVNVWPYLVFHSPSIFFLCFSFHRKNTKARLFPGGADLGFFFSPPKFQFRSAVGNGDRSPNTWYLGREAVRPRRPHPKRYYSLPLGWHFPFALHLLVKNLKLDPIQCAYDIH